MDAVEQLLAKDAIREVVYRYCRAMDRMDRSLALSCWHPGGTADYGTLYQGGGAGFIDWVWAVHGEGFTAHSHQVTNLLIALDGDEAASEAYVTVALRGRARSGPALDVVSRGRYLDRWSKRAGVWALEHRQHVTDLSSLYGTSPDSADDGAGRRDTDDPSYEILGGPR